MRIGKSALLASSALVAVSLAGPALAQASSGLAGFYVGGNIGYSWGSLPVSIATAPFSVGSPIFQNFPGSTASTTMHLNGMVGGGQIGYNWYITPGWLFGVETDLQATGEKAYFSSRTSGRLPTCSYTSAACTYSNLTDLSAKLSWFGTLRGRFGPEVNGLWIYGTAGFAYGRITASGSNAFQYLAQDIFSNFTYASLNSTSAFSFANINTGWTIGAGVEGRLGASNWSWKIEYLHIDLGTVGTVIYGSTPPVTVTLGRFTDDILRVGLNFGFRP